MNKDFVKNIRKYPMKLVLQAYSGMCRINKVSDLPGVVTVFFYPEGVNNILLQHIMAMNSYWDIKYSTKIFKKTHDPKYLKYNYVTSEGAKLSFFLDNK